MRRHGNGNAWRSRALLAVAAAFTACAQVPAVHAWTDRLTLPAYREGDPPTAPQFAAWNADAAHYPYPLRSNLTHERENRTWRTLNLENEYLLCRVLPDLGGHLYSCRDKRNGREIFHANPAIRPGMVGLRGAWDAMGIESNFPVGHTRVTTSPVDFAIRSDPDGSARAIVEEIDRVSGMQWRVEFVLRPASSVLEQRVLLYNRSAARWPYSWWANAEITFDDPGLRFILPAHAVSTPGAPSRIVAWPPGGGKDGAMAAHHRESETWFAYGTREPFFAVYKPGSRSGVAHVADPAVVAGKEIRLWGTERDRWVEQALTENFPSYVELQGGLFQNQDTFEFLEPGQFRAFSEFWVPVYDEGGVSRATRDAVLNLQREPGRLTIEIGATRPIRGARIRISTEGKDAGETQADLTPAATYRRSIDNPGAAPYTIELLDSSGAVLLRNTEGSFEAETNVPLGKVAETDWNGADVSEKFYLARAEDNELHQRWAFALRDYTDGLRRYPSSLSLKKAAGRFFLNLNRFEEAAHLLVEVPADDEALYDLGVAQAMDGRDAEASAAFKRVHAESVFGRAAALELARIAARAGDLPGALAQLKPLLQAHSGPVEAGAMEVAMLRRSGRAEDAKRELRRWQEIDPADSMLRFEATLAGATDEDLWRHLSQDSQRVLDLADEYLGLGMMPDALALLERRFPVAAQAEIEPGAVPAGLNPMIAYYRAFCRSRMGQDPAADLAQAAAGFTRYLFPYRASSFAVLGNALKVNPHDALAHLLMARLLFDSLQTDGAIAEWQKARADGPKLPEVREELARTLIDVKKDPAGAFAVIKEGLSLDPGNAALRELSNRASEVLKPPIPARTAAASASTSTPKASRKPAAATAAVVPRAASSPLEIAHLALGEAAAGNVASATRRFNSDTFAAEKQPDEVRRSYIEVQLQNLTAMGQAGECTQALDQLFRLGNEDPALAFTLYGFDHFMRAAHFQYYAASLEALCHDGKNARKHWIKVSKMNEPVSSPEFAYPILAAWRLDPAQAAPRIAAALAQVGAERAKPGADSRKDLMFLEGALLRAAGKDQLALERLQAAQSSSDVWLRYLTTVEAREILRQAR